VKWTYGLIRWNIGSKGERKVTILATVHRTNMAMSEAPGTADRFIFVLMFTYVGAAMVKPRTATTTSRYWIFIVRKKDWE